MLESGFETIENHFSMFRITLKDDFKLKFAKYDYIQILLEHVRLKYVILEQLKIIYAIFRIDLKEDFNQEKIVFLKLELARYNCWSI